MHSPLPISLPLNRGGAGKERVRRGVCNAHTRRAHVMVLQIIDYRNSTA
jgi:hypothetical protein